MWLSPNQVVFLKGTMKKEAVGVRGTPFFRQALWQFYVLCECIGIMDIVDTGFAFSVDKKGIVRYTYMTSKQCTRPMWIISCQSKAILCEVDSVDSVGIPSEVPPRQP